jgi:uncharacterized protein YjbJ (UPF0337 family)
MRLSFIVSGVLATSVGLSVTPILHSLVWAQGVPPTGQMATPNAKPSAKPGVQPSIKDAAGQLKTDTGKTKDDLKSMDASKAQQDVGQVNKDVQGIEDSAKGLLSNPFGKLFLDIDHDQPAGTRKWRVKKEAPMNVT